jgi:signal transduction histidine kinase
VQIQCDGRQLTVAFSNIIMNSVQALSDGGTIAFSVEEKSDRVIIEISDSGPGIPQENLQKIFEPLFTTKPAGTGLGLVSCKNIIEQHRGKISVRNNPTTVIIELPKKH